MAAGLSILLLLSALAFTFIHVQSCGTTTHIEIAHRALQNFQAKHSKFNISYGQLMKTHQDAFQGGNPYPDAMYPDICFSGKYHSVAEDTHWAPFLNASINYIRHHYSPPWNEETEKLVVFILGMASHQVADVSWHGLGIDQGFLPTMGKINFHGSFSRAHPVGDLGGDILTQYELKLPYIGELAEWYVPIFDLEKIYEEYYGRQVIPTDVITLCSTLMYLTRLGEDLAVAELFSDYANKSTYLVDRFEDYFLGGLDSMAAETQNLWEKTILMLEQGTSACSIPKNPLYITCSETHRTPYRRGDKSKNGYYMAPNLKGVDMSSVQMTKTQRGIFFRPSEKYLKALKEKKSQNAESKHVNVKTTNVDVMYTSSSEYSKMGWSLASGDIDHDGYTDLLMGSPGWAKTGNIQQGRVYIVYGSANGLPTNASGKSQIIDGPDQGKSKFGSSVAVLDVNLDGIDDVVVGAPSLSAGGVQYDYNGMVYIYFGSSGGSMPQPNMTISCSSPYCNWGWSLCSGDINADNYPDLLIGSPYAPGGGEQRGFVAGLFSSQKYTSQEAIHLMAENLDWIMTGDQDYGWLGDSLVIKRSWVVIGQPVYRICALKNCSYSDADKQSVGRIHVLKATTNGPVLKQTLIGLEEFAQFGTSLSIGRPYDNNTDVLAVSAVTSSVQGKIFMVNQALLDQVGQVYLYNLTQLELQQNDIYDRMLATPMATFSGNRRYGRFGAALEFSDLRDSGFEDLVISSPLYSQDIFNLFPSEAEEGRVFVFNGGSHFPRGNATCGCQGNIEPCPEDKANLTLSFNDHEKKARFGTRLTVAHSEQESLLVISAVHSSYQSIHMQGAVGVYSVPKRKQSAHWLVS